MANEEYTRELWIYSGLVVVAFCISGAWGVARWKVVDMHSAITAILAFVAFFLFLYATIRFGQVLEFDPPQWFAAILLLLVCGVGSVIYMVTRKPAEESTEGTEPC